MLNFSPMVKSCEYNFSEGIRIVPNTISAIQQEMKQKNILTLASAFSLGVASIVVSALLPASVKAQGIPIVQFTGTYFCQASEDEPITKAFLLVRPAQPFGAVRSFRWRNAFIDDLEGNDQQTAFRAERTVTSRSLNGLSFGVLEGQEQSPGFMPFPDRARLQYAFVTGIGRSSAVPVPVAAWINDALLTSTEDGYEVDIPTPIERTCFVDEDPTEDDDNYNQG